MAHRDKSQGFAFAYFDIADFLKEQKELYEQGKVNETPLHGPNVINMNRDPQPVNAPPALAPKKETPLKEVTDNLDRLQSLHHKLHAMLEDLNKVTDWRKKKKD